LLSIYKDEAHNSGLTKMKVRVAIAKRRAKRIAAGAIIYMRGINHWLLCIYGVADKIVSPFSGSFSETLERALTEGNEILKVNLKDWVKIEESEVEKYIYENTRNRWYPSKYKSVIKAEQEKRFYKKLLNHELHIK
jgi:hypothetical protein